MPPVVKFSVSSPYQNQWWSIVVCKCHPFVSAYVCAPKCGSIVCTLGSFFLQIHTKRIKIISKHVKIDEIMFNCIIFTLPVCGMQCVGLVYVHTRQAPTLELLLHVVSVPTFSRTKCLYVSSIIHIFHRQQNLCNVRMLTDHLQVFHAMKLVLSYLAKLSKSHACTSFVTRGFCKLGRI